MTIVFSHELFRQHDPGEHPETPRRLEVVEHRLLSQQLLEQCALGSTRLINPKELLSVHERPLIEAARVLCAEGGGYLDPDTICSEASYEVALTAVGTAAAAVDQVVSGHHKNALCLIRPPGHHATPNRSMGFCIFNNVAIAARYAQSRHSLGKILIVDWDVHHGNGTQDVFYDDDSVTFFSIHRFPFYPGTGRESETGTGKGLGATFNVPVAFGTSRADYLNMLRDGVEKAAAATKPDLILISAGFDAHADDPVGSLGLQASDFTSMTSILADVADTYCQGRIVSCLEGGYNLSALAESVEAHLRELLRRP